MNRFVSFGINDLCGEGVHFVIKIVINITVKRHLLQQVLISADNKKILEKCCKIRKNEDTQSVESNIYYLICNQ